MKFNQLSIAEELIDIGDDKLDYFSPYAKIRKWGDECSIGLRYQTLAKKDFVLASGKVVWADGNEEHSWYTKSLRVGDEVVPALGYDIVFLSKPASNKIQLEVDSTNVRWDYQPPLTDEIKIGYRDIVTSVTETTAYDKDGNVIVYRPPEVVGSYVLQRTNHCPIYRSAAEAEKYKCGIAGIILRPKLVDAPGHESWASMSLKDGLLTIEMDKTFLDAATYPVILDPDFGYTTAGSSYETWSTDYLVGMIATSPADSATGTTWLIKSYCKMHNGGAATGNFKGVIYTNATNAIVSNGVGGVSTQIVAAADWKVSTYSTAPTVPNSTAHVVCSLFGNSSSGNFGHYYNTTGAGVYDGNSYATPAVLDRSTIDRSQSVYASYTSAGGTAALTGTITSATTEADIVTGGKTIILTLTGDTWVATVGADNAITTALIAGIDSAQAEATGWDAVVKANMVYTDTARTSNTVVTITLGAEATYNITATETITVTIPATAVTLAAQIVATPTFTVAPVTTGIPWIHSVGSGTWTGISTGVN